MTRDSLEVGEACVLPLVLDTVDVLGNIAKNRFCLFYIELWMIYLSYRTLTIITKPFSVALWSFQERPFFARKKQARSRNFKACHINMSSYFGNFKPSIRLYLIPIMTLPLGLQFVGESVEFSCHLWTHGDFEAKTEKAGLHNRFPRVLSFFIKNHWHLTLIYVIIERLQVQLLQNSASIRHEGWWYITRFFSTNPRVLLVVRQRPIPINYRQWSLDKYYSRKLSSHSSTTLSEFGNDIARPAENSSGHVKGQFGLSNLTIWSIKACIIHLRYLYD